MTVTTKLIRLTQNIPISWHLVVETFNACFLYPSGELHNFVKY